jgi:light-harvesting complex I chlorophyll a/b binding protein 1
LPFSFSPNDLLSLSLSLSSHLLAFFFQSHFTFGFSHPLLTYLNVPFVQIKSSLQLDGSMAGDVGFDPLGLSNIDDVGIDLYWLREAELKHCRVAMMAVAGITWVELFGPAPGCEMATAKDQMDAFWQIWGAHPQYIAFGLIMIMFIETFSGIAVGHARESGDRAPGDFGLDPLGYGKGDAAAFDKLKEQEVANGRLAMIAAAGELVQGCTTGHGAFENLMQALSDNAF